MPKLEQPPLRRPDPERRCMPRIPGHGRLDPERLPWCVSRRGNRWTTLPDGRRLTIFLRDDGWHFCIADRERLWREFRELALEKAKLVTAERAWLIKLRGVMTLEQGMALMHAIKH